MSLKASTESLLVDVLRAVYSGTPLYTADRVGNAVTFTIGAAADGSVVASADLGAVYEFVNIRCEDCAGVDANTTLSLYTGVEAADTLAQVMSPETGAAYTPVVPATGTMSLTPAPLLVARYVRIVLSVVTTAPVVFTLRGVGQVG